MHIREFTGADFEPVSKILGDLWHANHGDHAFWQGADELCDHLAHTDKGLVAEDESGVLCGVVLLASPNPADHNETLRMHWLQQRTRLAAMASALGVDARADVVLLNEESELMTQVAHQFGTDGVGKVVLLVVSEAARGKGVGSALWDAGTSWLRERGASRIRLVTDDECDWQFYEHLGLNLLISRTTSVGPTVNLYVYEA